MKNVSWVQYTQELRRSNAITPIPSGKKYRRRDRSQKAQARNNE